MKYVAPSKFFASSLLVIYVLFTPFISPGQTAPRFETSVWFKGYLAPALALHGRWMNQMIEAIHSGQDLISPPAPPAATATPHLAPELVQFINQVTDGKAGVVRGIYAADILALRVVQQPVNNWTYVSDVLGNATEFQNASRNGVIGLLAHNTLSGRSFYNLKPGEQISIVYGDGAVRYYRVSGAYQFQKLDPGDLSSKLVDLATGSVVTSGQVFKRFYDGADHITLQTCLEKNGLSTWGLYFVVALPE